jgi:hypothetical protein
MDFYGIKPGLPVDVYESVGAQQRQRVGMGRGSAVYEKEKSQRVKCSYLLNVELREIDAAEEQLLNVGILNVGKPGMG